MTLDDGVCFVQPAIFEDISDDTVAAAAAAAARAAGRTPVRPVVLSSNGGRMLMSS